MVMIPDGYTVKNGGGFVPITSQLATQLAALQKQIAQQTAYSAPKPTALDPFSVARSGTQSGTLQPYVNRMNQNASDALYGGLLNYSPQSLQAPSAGGVPNMSNVPSFNLPSALSAFNGFGARSWMPK